MAEEKMKPMHLASQRLKVGSTRYTARSELWSWKIKAEELRIHLGGLY